MIFPSRNRTTREISGTISSMWCVIRISVVPALATSRTRSMKPWRGARSRAGVGAASTRAGPPADPLGYGAGAKDAVGGQEGPHHGLRGRDSPFAVARDEAVVQIRRDDPDLRTQIEDIPRVFPHH